MTKLTGSRKGSKSGKAGSLVIFLHGYGADGNDLLGLADPLSEYLPDTVFLAPNAPERCTNNPMGYQWAPIPWLDGSSEEAAKTGQEASIVLLNEYIDEALEKEGVLADRTVLVGFSQGTMMALHVGPRRNDQLAGIIGFSGKLLYPERLEAEAATKPPVLLVHGDADDVVPPSHLPEAADALAKAGFEVYTHISKNTGHGIAQDGLGAALQFLQMKLG